MPLTDPLSSVVTALQRENIIPDVVPDTFYPSLLLTATWPSGKSAMLGNILTPEETLEEPEISFTPMAVSDSVTGEFVGGDAAGEATYTVVMTDPDAPSRSDPKYGQWRHWVLTGLRSPPDTSVETANMSALKLHQSTTPYRAPGPPPGSGFHRYVFLMFQEPSHGNFTIPSDAPEHKSSELADRRNWDAIKFADKYGLKLVGANFFLAEHTSN